MSLGLAPVLRGEGQWAFGHREPLNEDERVKRDDSPLNVRTRIETNYAGDGPSGIPADDLQRRFRWWGLYPAEAPGYLTLRIRVDGGQLTAAQLALIAKQAHRFGTGAVELTAWQGVRIPGVPLRDVPEIWRGLDTAGLSTLQTGGDCPRPVLGSPTAGLSPHELVDTGATVREIVDRFLGHPGLLNLPHRFASAVCWQPDVPRRGQDLVLLGVRHPVHGPGFDVQVGSGAAGIRRLGAWVSPDDAADLWFAVAEVFRDYGYRRDRARARFGFLTADWGLVRLREVVESRFGRALPHGLSPAAVARPVTRPGLRHERAEALTVGVAAPGPAVPAPALRRLADAAGAYGSGRLRLAPGRGVLVTGVPTAFAEPLRTRLHSLGFGTAATWPELEEASC